MQEIVALPLARRIDLGFFNGHFSSYLLRRQSELAPPFHLTEEGGNIDIDRYQSYRRKIVKNRITGGMMGKLSTQFFTYWGGAETPSWEHEAEFSQ